MKNRILELTQEPIGFLLMAGLLFFGGILDSSADKPLSLQLFNVPDLLEEAVQIQRASGEEWSDLITLDHFVTVPDKDKLDEDTKATIQTWEEKNKAKLIIISEDDRRIGRSALPKLKISLYEHKSTNRIWKTEDLIYPRVFDPDRVQGTLFQLMGEYFDQKYQSDIETNWAKVWLNPMKALSSESLVPRYVKLGTDRLSRVNPQSDVSLVPLEDSSSLLPLTGRDQLLQTAIDAFSEAITENPDAANSNYLGVSYYLQGDYNKAEERFQQAVQRERRSKTYRLNLARTHVKLGKKQEALGMLELLNPKDPEVKKLRDRLRGRDTVAWLNTGTFLVLAGGSVALATTARSDADNAFEEAQSISPPQPIVAEEPTPALNSADLEKQSNDWEEYRKFDRRAIMGNITAVSFALNSVPFVLDGGNKKLAEKKWWIGYLLKSGIFIGFSMKYELDRGDAEDEEKKATRDEDKLYYRGLREQTTETRNLCFANAVIDLATAGVFHFWSDPQDGLDLSYRSDGKNNHELMLVVTKPF